MIHVYEQRKKIVLSTIFICLEIADRPIRRKNFQINYGEKENAKLGLNQGTKCVWIEVEIWKIKEKHK